MNYYERHLGDYTKDTAHLTLIEHGAYTLLLDRYYSTEKGIPENQAHRVARARTKEEKEAVDIVLGEFFTLVNGTWIKNRVEGEITKYQERVRLAQLNGKKGGRPPKNETDIKPAGFPLGSISEPTQQAHHTPDSKHQSPNLKPEIKHTELETTGGEDETPEPVCVTTNFFKPTHSGLYCKAMMSQGVQACNPHHPTLLALIDAGATEQEFAQAAKNAVDKGKANFAYVLGTVKKQREDAAKLVLHHGRLPNKQEILEQSNRAATAGWLPPELRGAKYAN